MSCAKKSKIKTADYDRAQYNYCYKEPVMHSGLLEGLNAPQREAVIAPLGHQLVLAGAGSGKTRVLVSRIAWLIEQQHLPAEALLAVTFTNKAATEMKHRLSGLLQRCLAGLWIGTFHGLCHRLLRRHYVEAGLPEAFHILDSDDQGRLIKRVIASMQLDDEKWPVKQAQAFINARKDEGIRSSQTQAPAFGPEKTWVAIYQAYEQACQTAGVIDFAELLLRAYDMLQRHPDLLAHYQQRFQIILVDEFQDTNTMQYAWIRQLAGSHAAVTAVGDDDQSIYGWRGAKIENIQRFSRDFKDTAIVRLEQNYRSTATILSAANALIDNNRGRMGKSLWTQGDKGEPILVYAAFNELDEARFIRDRITMAVEKGVYLNDIAVLYRSNAQSRVIEEALLHAGIAYRIHGGVRFFDRAEVKDTLAYLRLLAHTEDDSAFERVVNFPTRGVGEKTLDALRQMAKTAQIPMWAAARNVLAENLLPARAASALMAFIQLIETLQKETKAMALDEQINAVLQASGLYAHFSKVKGERSESRLDNLQELVNAAREFRYEENDDENLPLLTAFLAHASLEAGETQAAVHESHVHLMTLHAAKGLEFSWVFLTGLEEGVFPGRQSFEDPARLEEERRLCYVGMTRAMQQLIVTYAEVRRQYGREEYHKSSRFLSELPPELLETLRVKARVFAADTSGIQSNVCAMEAGLPLGKSVSHAKFGQGVLLAVEGSGAHTRVQVNFSQHGTKWLVLAYANLEML